MAGRLISISTEATEISLTAATVKTVLEFTAPTNIACDVAGYGVSFDGVSVTDEPVEMTLVRKSAAGTGTAVTERDWDEDSTGTIQLAARVNMSAEGTISYSYQPENVHPQQGWGIVLPRELWIPIEPGGIWGIRCLAPQAQDVHAWALVWE